MNESGAHMVAGDRADSVSLMPNGVESPAGTLSSVSGRLGFKLRRCSEVGHPTVHVFVDEVDAAISPVKAKGIGELGLTGVAPAVANAVYNATGVRVRQYPITLDKLLDGLPAIV
jgi:hypothetical protein